RAAWRPPRGGWRITACRRRPAASATPASRRCSCRPRTLVAPTSASSDRRSLTLEDYWGREGLEQAILDALAAMGKDPRAPTGDDLAPLDQFHGGGKAVTVRFARLAGLGPGMRVLDVSGGSGGPAPT